MPVCWFCHEAAHFSLQWLVKQTLPSSMEETVGGQCIYSKVNIVCVLKKGQVSSPNYVWEKGGLKCVIIITTVNI